MANPPIKSLMQLAGRNAISKFDPYADDEEDPNYTFDQGYDSIREQLSKRPEPYHDPDHDVLVPVPGVDKVINNKKRGMKVLGQMAEDLDYPLDDNPVKHGSEAYKNIIQELMLRQRGKKEKL